MISFDYQNKLTFYWTAQIQYTETDGYSQSIYIKRVDGYPSKFGKIELDVTGEMQFAVIPTIQLDVSLSGGTSFKIFTIPLLAKLKPYILVVVSEDIRCRSPSVGYKTFWGVEWGAQVLPFRLHFPWDITLDFKKKLPWPNPFKWRTAYPMAPLRCEYCNWCVRDLYESIATVLFDIVYAGALLTKQFLGTLHQMTIKFEQALLTVEQQIGDSFQLFPSSYKMSLTIGNGIALVDKFISVLPNVTKILKLDLTDRFALVNVTMSLMNTLPNANLSIEAFNDKNELLATVYNLIPAGELVKSTFLVPKGLLKITYFDQDKSLSYGPMLYTLTSDMNIVRDIRVGFITFHITIDNEVPHFRKGKWLLFVDKNIARNQPIDETSMGVVAGL